MTAFALAVAIGFNVFATTVHSGTGSEFTIRISRACTSSLLTYRPKLKPKAVGICSCVAEKLVSKVVRFPENGDVVSQLEWIERFYLKTHAGAEIERDPFFLDETLQAVGESCLASP